MLNSNILFVVHSYNSFQKESINSLCKYCNECSVLVRSNPIAEISKYITIPYLNPFKLDYKIDLTNTPSNVSVYSTPILYAPLDSQYKRLGKKHSNAVEKVIRNNNIKFDLIHSHFTWSSGYAGAKLKEKYNVPFVVTAHGYDIYILPFKDDEWKERIEYVLNSADHIITVSKSNLACIRKLNVNTPVTVLPNGYRDEIFHQRNLKTCRDTLNLPHDKKIILAVGNLMEIKGHKYLIEAMNEVVKHRNDVQCYIVGCGRLENKLKKQIVAASLQDHVRLVGCKPHDDIPIWMNACDVFVLPSLSESFGVVQIEAMACGKPVVATYNGGSEEIVISEAYGLLSEPVDSEKLADNILSALDKSWDIDEIKEYAKRFMWKNIATEILEVYSSVV